MPVYDSAIALYSVMPVHDSAIALLNKERDVTPWVQSLQTG